MPVVARRPHRHRRTGGTDHRAPGPQTSSALARVLWADPDWVRKVFSRSRKRDPALRPGLRGRLHPDGDEEEAGFLHALGAAESQGVQGQVRVMRRDSKEAPKCFDSRGEKANAACADACNAEPGARHAQNVLEAGEHALAGAGGAG
ncbi:MAG: hypothetical protein MZV70_13035 [Desulfobacterales bacterium]|nr:hypothetical protein [Desulfobacterales bacterium]